MPTLAVSAEIKRVMDRIDSIEDNISSNVKEYKSVTQIIDELYKEVIDGCKNKIELSYVDNWYNPTKKRLNDANLLLNLQFLKILQQYYVIEWYFDDVLKNFSNYEFNLQNEWWSKILEENTTDDKKYIKILYKNLKLKFYDAMFKQLSIQSAKIAYNKTQFKYHQLLSEDEVDLTFEEYLVEWMINKTTDGCIIMCTPNISKYFKLNNVEKVLTTEDDEIQYIGEYKGRKIYIINNQKGVARGFNNGAFFINKDDTTMNKFIINPEKPLVYFNTIENPFLEKPILKMWVNIDFKFYQNVSNFIEVMDLNE